MGYIVLAHYLDEDADPVSYRLVVGHTEQVEIEVEVDNGDEPKIAIETVVVAEEDFLFSADDKRWERFKGPETVAAKQREIVLEALERREAQAQADEAREGARTHLSDLGSSL
jgi:hypothetical protein